MPYVDDFVSRAFRALSLLIRSALIFSRAERSGMVLSLKKWFAGDVAEVLGFLLDAVRRVRRICPKKYSAITNYAEPANAKALQKFLYITLYCRECIKGYSTLASMLAPYCVDEKTFKKIKHTNCRK